jgi:hypothetical protein
MSTQDVFICVSVILAVALSQKLHPLREFQVASPLGIRDSQYCRRLLEGHVRGLVAEGKEYCLVGHLYILCDA